MKRRRLKKIFSIFLVLFFFSAVIFTILAITMNKPPVKEVKSYLEIIGKAKKSNADLYAAEYYNAAEKKYYLALKEWKLQNNKFFYFRNYSKVKEYILVATLKAQEAVVSSGSNKDSMKMKYLQEAEMLKKKLDNYHDLFIRLPLKVNIRKNYEFGKLALEEGLNSYGKGDYIKAFKKLNEGKSKISSADIEVNKLLRDYFGNFPKWRNWVDETIRKSAQNNNYAFIVDKIKHRGYLYYDGRQVKEYEIELGRNWIGDKEYAGDNATPEGMYRVTGKKGYGGSRYHKALMINYPNDEDRAQFSEKKRKGMLTRGSRLGGLIEVHGDGGKQSDWTSGCVALRNENMDELFSRMSPGSPVTIVGSFISLSELLN
jgi:murein L,D-transpeptidase YafK